MKNLKYALMIFMLLIGINSIHAQQDQKMERKQEMERSHHYTQDDYYKKMQEELSLTSTQMKKIKIIGSKRSDEMRKLNEQMKHLKEEERKEINSLLTPEQSEKFQKYTIPLPDELPGKIDTRRKSE